MKDWRPAWRAMAALMPIEGLIALRQALIDDSEALLQGATTEPPPLICVQDWACEGACAAGYAFWRAGHDTVGEVEECFARLCFEADRAMGEPAGVRHFLNWFDETPRDEMRRELLPEVNAEVARRSP
jgi:hypothetical protein